MREIEEKKCAHTLRYVSIFFRRYPSKEQDLGPLRVPFSDSTRSDPASSLGDAIKNSKNLCITMRKNPASFRLALYLPLILGMLTLHAQQSKRVLFIGNSYTGNNNLPQIIAQCALSSGDTLIHDRNTPGGSTLEAHSTNNNTLNRIRQGHWDYVVLQEQSQRPSFPDHQVEQQVFPFAAFLNTFIKTENPCAETIFYMTWGRKNGDANNCSVWPPVCTYEGMDSLLFLRYMQMTHQNDAIVSPVGAVWKFIRENHPEIELYAADQHHPSFAGSYAAACSFYTVIFRKDPSQITWQGNLNTSTATAIREAAKTVVFDNLIQWRIGVKDPVAHFEASNLNPFEYLFTNESFNFTNSYWYVNGEFVSDETDLVFQFPEIGTYSVKLRVERCDQFSIYESTIEIDLGVGTNSSIQDNGLMIYPNPAHQFLYLNINRDGPVTIFDLMGRPIYHRWHKHQEKANIDLSSFLPGKYILATLDRRFVFYKI